MVVESASRLSMRRPNSIILKDNSVELFVAFESKEEKIQWMDFINQVSGLQFPWISEEEILL